MPGDARLVRREFDLLLEWPATDFPLFAPPREPIELTEYAAGINVARTIVDGGTLQLGIGSLGDAVTHALILRHRPTPTSAPSRRGSIQPTARRPDCAESGTFDRACTA